MGRQRGLLASVKEGRMNLTFIIVEWKGDNFPRLYDSNGNLKTKSSWGWVHALALCAERSSRKNQGEISRHARPKHSPSLEMTVLGAFFISTGRFLATVKMRVSRWLRFIGFVCDIQLELTSKRYNNITTHMQLLVNIWLGTLLVFAPLCRLSQISSLAQVQAQRPVLIG